MTRTSGLTTPTCGFLAVVALVLSSAAGAHAQATAPQDRINAAMTRARQVGLPVTLLESKIAEGKAKGISQDRIAAAIERRLSALERANQALRGEAGAAASLAVGADALEAGVSEAVLKALAEDAPRDRRLVAIVALTELVRQGQASDIALNRVRDALKKGPDALSNLPAESSSGRGSGGSDNQQRGNSSGNPGQGNSGKGNSGKGNSGKSGGAQVGADAAPPVAVPAPGQPSQAGRPDNSGSGSGRGNSGRGNSGGNSGGNPGGGGGNSGGGNPGRGGK